MRVNERRCGESRSFMTGVLKLRFANSQRFTKRFLGRITEPTREEGSDVQKVKEKSGKCDLGQPELNTHSLFPLRLYKQL
ncbi:hypothetical protein E2C01_086748 [Portunus trituberculatus]|uniref:Uncharacterized protein n=1 Tax=Portunus trituberculatus TaxID=210409 RepID=A0A5B7JBD4_PORTR|nr:hypothetical protein [Portunus trituberculatus]